MPQPTLGKPFVEVQWEMLHHNPSILYFRALLLQIQVCSAAYLKHLTMSLQAALLSAALQVWKPNVVSSLVSVATVFHFTLAFVSANRIAAGQSG